MLDYLGDVSDVTGANFTENTFEDPDETSDKPIPLLIVLSTRKKRKEEKSLPRRHQWS
jgi:hypothetical protein